ncbi:hypothetical protein [Chromobacterium sp. IIBBL 290-4]|uniref:hypothetical protein n=1 Tax=Chromobacterium sp. IIBBL 290-4 TaxID=2953890 RepID=UPI0020B8B53E|nr:hypothetical protein [Chromobacterium sp. IIBBL 290-4]UTH72538.1 hypothetical protein NKT35_13355 [Chromobacterium sp. IIBBL 290-4]
MFLIFRQALRRHAWLRLFCGALALSSIGSGLTFIVVFAALSRLQASPSSFALAFILSSAPGLAGSKLGEKLLRRADCRHALMLAKAIGLIGLILPALGLHWQSIPVLQLAESVSSLAAGLALPAISHYSKAKLAENELAAAAFIDTLVFACHVLLGIGIGVWLEGRIDDSLLLLLNAGSYALAIALLCRLPALRSETGAQAPVQALPPQLDSAQRGSLLLLPALTAVGAPAMALLPTLTPHASSPQQTVLALLFARSLGQLCGPLLIRERQLQNQPLRLILLCLAGFVGCYQMAAVLPWLSAALILVFLAHVLSNVVFCLGWHGLLRRFDAAQIAAASACSYRRQVWVAALSAAAAGLLADEIGSQTALLLCSGSGLSLSAAVLWRSRLSPAVSPRDDATRQPSCD